MGLFERRRRVRVSNPNSLNRPKQEAAGEALTASGSRITRRNAEMMRRLIQGWQARSFGYYNILGEIKYASQFYSRSLSNLELFAGEMDSHGDIVQTTNPKAIAALDRIQDPGGGRSVMLASYGKLMFLAGECILLVSQDSDGMEQWEMLSTDELTVQSGSLTRYRAPSLITEEYKEPDDDEWAPLDEKTAVPYRLWQPHPQFSALADSTMMGVLDDCEELVLLKLGVRARAKSRLAGNGILAISEEFSQAPLEPVGDEDPDEDIFLRDLNEAMLTPIGDPGAASAVVPLIVRGSTDAVEKGIKHIQLVDPNQLYPETGLRWECIKRIATGLDMPPEILVGMTDSNHWTAWQIDEQTWKSHLQPKAQQLCDHLTSAYFRPYLRDVEHIPNARDFYVGYDASKIINHPDRSKDAMQLYDRRIIGKKAVRVVTDFDEEDAPTEEELAEMIGVETRDSSLAWYGEPAPRGGFVETSAGVVESAQAAEPAGEGTPPGTPPQTTGAKTVKEPPKEPQAPVTGALDRTAAVARILGASELGVLRAREAAGNRIRTQAKRDPEAAKLLEGVRAGQAAAVLGRARVRALNVGPESELVAGARGLIVDALRLWDITDEELVARITETVEKHAAGSLYKEKPGPLPDAFTGYIAGLLAEG